MSIVLGIDPGLDGAIAELTEAGELVERFLETAHIRGIPSERRGIYTLVR